MGDLDKMVGKRISEVCLQQRKGRVGAQFFLCFSDGDYCQLTSVDSDVEVIVSEIYDRRFHSEINHEAFEDIEYAKWDKDETYRKHAHYLFLRLWSLAVGTSEYEKQKWRELGQILSDAGIDYDPRRQ